MLMTEDQIERTVERKVDLLDLQLIGGTITQVEYDVKIKAINDWAEREYSTARKGGSK